MWEKILHYDTLIGSFFNQKGSENQDTFWVFITNTYSWIPFFILLIILNFYWSGIKKGLWVLLYILIAFVSNALITNLVKNSFQRLRPIYDPQQLEYFRFVTDASGYSFFSGHTSNSIAVSTLFYLIYRKKSPYVFLVFLWPLLFAYSRIYLGVHYPSDILFGALSGFIISLICYKIFIRFHCQPYS